MSGKLLHLIESLIITKPKAKEPHPKSDLVKGDLVFKDGGLIKISVLDFITIFIMLCFIVTTVFDLSVTMVNYKVYQQMFYELEGNSLL